MNEVRLSAVRHAASCASEASGVAACRADAASLVRSALPSRTMLVLGPSGRVRADVFAQERLNGLNDGQARRFVRH